MMKRTILLLVVFAVAVSAYAQMTPEEAQRQMAEREKARAAQADDANKAANELRVENAKLRLEIVQLRKELAAAQKRIADFERAQAAKADEKKPFSAPMTDADRKVFTQLDKQIPVVLDGQPLADVIEYFRATSGANFVVNWNLLELEGIDKVSVVTLKQNKVAVGQALTMLLSQNLETAPETRLHWDVIDGSVVISTFDDLAKRTVSHAFDVRPLMRRGVSAEQLLDLVRTSVAPEQWLAAGGTNWSVQELNGALVVKASPWGQRQVADVLSKLHEQRK